MIHPVMKKARRKKRIDNESGTVIRVSYVAVTNE